MISFTVNVSESIKEGCVRQKIEDDIKEKIWYFIVKQSQFPRKNPDVAFSKQK